MNKVTLTKPVLICLYGFPGSGKSFMARNLADVLNVASVNGDRIRHELFESPRYDQQENAIVGHLMRYMTEEFLNSGLGVVYDTNCLRISQRRKLRELAHKHKAEYILVWVQIDHESAFSRLQNRDRRTADDKFAEPHTRLTFEKHLGGMQNPVGEDYVVISGKHAFVTQKAAVINRLYQLGLIKSGVVQDNVAKPGLVNLIPNPHAGRVDLSRRNIAIH